MNTFFKRRYESIVKILGDIKVFPHPFFIVYDPSSYRIHGREVRQFQKLLKPGDIILRKYQSYLDDHFIPGFFSHAALYLGPTTESDRELVDPKFQDHFTVGPEMIIHSMAEGVFVEDLIDFCKCDYMLVLRIPEVFDPQFSHPESTTDFTEHELEFLNKLKTNQPLTFAEVWPALRDQAISKAGAKYDFEFNFSNYNDVSCTEFVHYTYRSLQAVHGVKPLEKKVLMIRKKVIDPDGFTLGALTPIAASDSLLKPTKPKKIPKAIRDLIEKIKVPS